MTPNQIIAQARVQFGERTAITLADSEFQGWVDGALKTIYNDLPSSEFRNLVSEDTISLVAGEGVVPDSWDRLLDARDADVPLRAVAPDVLAHIDTNRFYAPTQPVWAAVGKTVFVRPTTLASITVVHQEPPPSIVWTGTTANADSELTSVNAKWHPALVHLVTSLAYQQEEDHNAAAMWRNRYSYAVGQTGQPTPPSEETV